MPQNDVMDVMVQAHGLCYLIPRASIDRMHQIQKTTMMGSSKQRGLAQASDQKALFGFERGRSPARLKQTPGKLTTVKVGLLTDMLHHISHCIILHSLKAFVTCWEITLTVPFKTAKIIRPRIKLFARDNPWQFMTSSETHSSQQQIINFYEHISKYIKMPHNRNAIDRTERCQGT